MAKKRGRMNTAQRVAVTWLMAGSALLGAQNLGALGRPPWQWFSSGESAVPAAAAGAASPDGGATAPIPAATASPAAPDYVIGAGDVLQIDVWQQKEISRTLPVRPDGRISLPLVGAIVAGGRTPTELAQAISAKLAPFVSAPVVTVMVDKIASRNVSVLGAVLRPGTYPLPGPTRVLQALAEAGGFTPYANPGSIELLRVQPDGTVHRFTFDYPDVIKGKHIQQDRLLEPGDTIIVP